MGISGFGAPLACREINFGKACNNNELTKGRAAEIAKSG